MYLFEVHFKKQIKNKIGFLLLWAFFCACTSQTSNSDTWSIVLKTDKDGKILKGSKGALIDAIRGGANIKIGWGGKREDISIEHLSSPIWLAILSEEEVMAHLDP